ncbi:MAG: hypothetical protein Q8K83_04930 [Methylotenera sp.]|nr:hypothetical protein [Methylotenera sp.]
MADNQGAAGADKKSILSIMLKDRKPVTTSQGTFYVRHLSVGDMKTFAGYFDEGKDKASQDLRALGELALKTLVCTDNDPEKTSVLTEEIFSQLSSTDIELLIDGVIEVNGLTPLPQSKTLECLGSVVFDKVTSDIKSTLEMAKNLKRSMSSAFGSLPQSAMKSLVDSMSSLNTVRDSLKLSPAVEAYRKLQEDNDRLLGGMAHKDLLAQANILETPQHRMPELYRPKFEETPIGRAAIASEDSATQLREVAGLVGDMADKLATLHTVFLTEVIPQWVDSLEKNSGAMRITLSQTEKSLFWAKWALIASVVVTILMTVWQIWIVREYKLENDKQQTTSVLIMKEQLKASQELNKQLKTDAMQLKEELVKLQQSVGTLNATQSAKLKAVQEAK